MKQFGETLEEILDAFRPRFGPAARAARTKPALTPRDAWTRIGVTAVLLAVACVCTFVYQDPFHQKMAISLFSAIGGYWLK